MRDLEPCVRACADAVIDALPRPCAMEPVTEIGYPFAVRAQATWLGWEGVEPALLEWMRENHAATRSADRTRTAAVAAAFHAIVAAQVQRRRRLGAAAPSDPTTELLHIRVDDESLSDGNIV
jgi:hypothetical protein